MKIIKSLQVALVVTAGLFGPYAIIRAIDILGPKNPASTFLYLSFVAAGMFLMQSSRPARPQPKRDN